MRKSHQDALLTITSKGEHEHRRVKTRYRMSSKNNPTPQIIKQGVFFEEMRVRAAAVRQAGVDIPLYAGEQVVANPHASSARRADSLSEADLRPRYYIAKDERNRRDLGALIASGSTNDPAFQVRFLTTHSVWHPNGFPGLRSSAQRPSFGSNTKYPSCSGRP